MFFRPSANSKITLCANDYRFMEHPAAKGMPYGQMGRRATVYQVQDVSGKFYALKVFFRDYRSAQTEQSAQKLQAFAHLPGLQVCSRTVLTKQNNASIVQQYPDLEYAVLMPWVEGQTWQEVLLSRQPLTSEQSLALAQQLASIMATMEQNGLAHCDLSGPNVLISGLAPFSAGKNIQVALVDVEDIFSASLKKPAILPGGSAGYGHKTASQGLWSAEADRFAGAVLLAEMLTWCDESVCRIAVGEQYFEINELQENCDRYNVLLSVLKQRYGSKLANCFSSVWFSTKLEYCQSLLEWSKLLGTIRLPETKIHNEVSPQNETNLKSTTDCSEIEKAVQIAEEYYRLAPGLGDRTYARALLNRGQTYQESGNLPAAIADFSTAIGIVSDGQLKEKIVAALNDVNKMSIPIKQIEQKDASKNIDPGHRPHSKSVQKNKLTEIKKETSASITQGLGWLLSVIGVLLIVINIASNLNTPGVLLAGIVMLLFGSAVILYMRTR